MTGGTLTQYKDPNCTPPFVFCYLFVQLLSRAPQIQAVAHVPVLSHVFYRLVFLFCGEWWILSYGNIRKSTGEFGDQAKIKQSFIH